MIGNTDRQTSFSDYWMENRIPKNSYWHKMHDWVMNNLNDNMFQELYSYYGRPSVSPVYTFAGILIQLEKNYSDTELEGESRFDDRIKFALTAPRDFEGIDAVTLCDHRSRLIKSEVGRKIFMQILEKAKREGMFDEENLHVIDSFMVLGAASRQDTYTMIYQGIKMLLKVCSFYNLSEQAWRGLKRDDYDMKRRKPRINWEDHKEKIKLVDQLVIDALELIKFVRENARKEYKDVFEIADLLEKIVNQDTYFDKDGTYKIIEGTARDRIISTVDPEMRHGRKSSSKLQDGYKTEIITGGKKGELVIALDVMPANAADGTKMVELLNETDENGFHVDKLYGDTAYSDMDEIKKREDETEFCVKVRGAVNKDGMFTKDEFEIDIEEGKVTCPAGNVATFDSNKEINESGLTIGFGKACKDCPLRESCTKSKNGRQITINKNESDILSAKEYQKTEEFKKDYAKRSNGERTISELTKHGSRNGRYIGLHKTKWQALMAAINNNIKKLMAFIISGQNPKKSQIEGDLCPFGT